ncbi:TadE/TadG family type IV pilus assembly protein [Kineococcus rhizosphaerae]|uniref:TadE-like protein n=1 Tax=Kineococcus rhizosphaerae TaxID=559628 RepID=A0A2T0R9G4_9ACTN|nr:TadE/TadG family type IV pilus assembly protein [Kineococcus rhizosphaerae]PRY17794.1 TadE-like protein [Kineococcus rhizosphaerae]
MTRRDEGSIALEFTLVAPALLLLILLLLAYARVTDVSATLDTGVRDAARAATTSRDPAAARTRAFAVVRAAVGPGNCADSLTVPPLAEFTPGRAVTVTARCTYSVADLGLPGLPGSFTVTSSFSSPLDPNREVS